MPNNATLQATERGELHFSKSLSENARTAVILPGLKSSSLISFGKLCDDDCDILLNKRKMYAVKNDEIVLEGDRNFRDRLWDIPVQKTELSPTIITNTPQHAGLYNNYSVIKPTIKQKRARINSLPRHYQNIFANMDKLIEVHECNNIVDEQLKNDRKKLYDHEFARMNTVIDDNMPDQFSTLRLNQEQKLNVIIRKKEPKANLASFLHGAAWSPVKSTFLTAIEKNHFTT